MGLTLPQVAFTVKQRFYSARRKVSFQLQV